MAAGDFDGDGKADLVVFGAEAVEGQVFLGKGDGTFTVGEVFATAVAVTTAKAVDLNRDGKLDLVAAGTDSVEIAVLMGAGDGTFQEPRTFSATAPPVAASVSRNVKAGRPALRSEAKA